jgi:hypothetical protein
MDVQKTTKTFVVRRQSRTKTRLVDNAATQLSVLLVRTPESVKQILIAKAVRHICKHFLGSKK